MEQSPLSGDSSRSTDRREANRTSTVFRAVLIEIDEFAGFCLVRNISPTGMMGEVYTEFAPNTPATVQFNDGLVVSGMIVWARNGRVGIRFDRTVDVPTVLAARPVPGKINRAPRLQIHCDGALVIDDRPLPIRILDISQRGIKAHAAFVRPGDEAFVRLEGLETRKVVVRWTQNGVAGLNFFRPLAFDELAAWVIGQQASKSSGAGDRVAAVDTQGGFQQVG